MFGSRVAASHAKALSVPQGNVELLCKDLLMSHNCWFRKSLLMGLGCLFQDLGVLMGKSRIIFLLLWDNKHLHSKITA